MCGINKAGLYLTAKLLFQELCQLLCGQFDIFQIGIGKAVDRVENIACLTIDLAVIALSPDPAAAYQLP